MSNSELLAQLQQLSRAEKFQIIQFLTDDLAKEEEISVGNEVAEIMGAVHTSNGAAEQLMQFIETEQQRPQNVYLIKSDIFFSPNGMDMEFQLMFTVSL